MKGAAQPKTKARRALKNSNKYDLVSYRDSFKRRLDNPEAKASGAKTWRSVSCKKNPLNRTRHDGAFIFSKIAKHCAVLVLTIA